MKNKHIEKLYVNAMIATALCLTGCSASEDAVNNSETNVVATQAEHEDSFMRVKNPDGKKQDILSVNKNVVYNAGEAMEPEEVPTEVIIETETVLATDEEGNEVINIVEVEKTVAIVEDTAENGDIGTSSEDENKLREDSTPIEYVIEDNFESLDGAVPCVKKDGDLSVFSDKLTHKLYNMCGGDEEYRNSILYAVLEAVEKYNIDINEIELKEDIGDSDGYEYTIYNFDSVHYIIKIALNNENDNDIKYIINER